MRALRFLVAGCAWLYFAAILAYLVALRWVGEGFWATTVALYLPHGLLLAPLALLVPGLALFGPRRLLVAALAAAVVVLFPIMGLHVGGPATPTGALHLRLLTYNVDSGKEPIAEVLAQVADAAPDVIVFQESDTKVNEPVAAALPGFTAQRNGQFFIVSRYPIGETELPPPVHLDGVERSPRFLRYTLDTPLGKVELFNVHPISPRDGFESIRGSGLTTEIESGRVFHGDRHALVANTKLRSIQVHAIADAAARSPDPVIIAGDTNLPNGSGILDALGGFKDAFAEVGRGFGYTFPAHKYRAWMRIDRILAGKGLRFIDVEVGSRHGSDHYCVFADLEKP